MRPTFPPAARAALFAVLFAVGVAHAAPPPGQDGPPARASEAVPLDMPATDAPPAPPTPTRLRLRTIPDLGILRRAAAEAGLDRVELRVYVEFDATGRITRAVPLQSSGSAAFDRVLVDWVKRAEADTQEAGRGRLPVVLEASDARDATLPQLPAFSEAVHQRARDAGLAAINVELMRRLQADGTWTASLPRGSGNASVDAAILEWASTLPPPRIPGGVVWYPVFEQVTPAP